ncbi:MAG: hypothetical protein OXI03_05470, partial [Chloroflexota bacterium]|nr:hypothetical protein [Chloroflexota bacterium]
MRLTIFASLLVGLLAGVVGALVVTLAIGGDDEETEQAVAALEAQLDRIAGAQAQATQAAQAAAQREDIQGLLNAVAPSVVLITTEYEDTGGSRGA